MQIFKFKSGMYSVLAVPVLHDNFVFLVCRDDEAVLIDAGSAAPVFEVLQENGLTLRKVLITHTHSDHDAGCRAIVDRLGTQAISPGVAGRSYKLLGTNCEAIATPGHVALHKCFYFPELSLLFTGDVLINGGCGRVCEGTPEQLFDSLQTLCALPDETQVFGGHDYLVENMKFALQVDPNNFAARDRLERYHVDPAAGLFTTLAEEKKTNPFLQVDGVERFAELRRWKDCF